MSVRLLEVRKFRGLSGAGGGVDHGEKQRPMALAAGRMDGGGLEPSADSDGTRRPKAASNPFDRTVEGF